jgi:hypothetical protein
MTLHDLIDANIILDPTSMPETADFWNYVVRVDYPTIYDGSMRLSGFARIVSKEYIDDDDEEDEDEGIDAIPLKVNLLRKYWYDHIIRPLMKNWDIVQMEEITEPWDNDEINFYAFDLGMATLLSRDDCKTWYMKHLGLSLCNSDGSVADQTAMEERVRRFQSEPFVNAVPQDARKYFTSPSIHSMTTKQTVLQAMTTMRSLKYMTFFDVLRVSFVNHEDNFHFESLEPYFSNVCRVLIPAEPAPSL